VLDNLTVTVFLLALLPLRRITTGKIPVCAEDDRELAEIAAGIKDRIKDLTNEIRATKNKISRAENNDASFWLLPNLPDEAVITQLRYFGIIDAEKNANEAVELDIEVVTALETGSDTGARVVPDAQPGADQSTELDTGRGIESDPE
jgi:hypothetical protein